MRDGENKTIYMYIKKWVILDNVKLFIACGFYGDLCLAVSSYNTIVIYSVLNHTIVKYLNYIKLRWALFVTYTTIQSVTSSEMCSLHLTHPSAHTPGAVGSRCCAPGEQLGVRCLAQGSHLSRGQFLLEPRFEPTTSGYKSDTLSIRATTAPN